MPPSIKKLPFRSRVAIIFSLALLISTGIVANNLSNIREPVSRAATLGPNLPTSAANDAAAGSIAWTSPTAALSSNDAWSSVTAGSSQASNYLRLTGFGFSIPTGATINGIVVLVESHKDNNLAYSILASMRKGTSYNGFNVSGALTATDQVFTLGSSTDTWGTSWTPADISSPNFGVGLYVSFGTNVTTTTFYVDQVRIAVYYTPLPPDTTPPTTPTNLSAVAVSTSQVNLGWTGSTDGGGSGLAGYRIFRGGVQIATTTSTFYSNTGLNPSTTYSYYVTAYDNASSPNVSGPSNTASATTFAQSDTTKPSIPGNLQVTGKTTTSISLGWSASSDNVGVTGYRVYRNNGGVISAVADVTSTAYSVTGLSPSTSYSYYIRAYDRAGNFSDNSNTVTTTTNAVSPPPPPPPPPPNGGGTSGNGNGSFGSGSGVNNLPKLPPPSNKPVANILNSVKLKFSVPYLVVKLSATAVVGSFSKEIEIVPGNNEIIIDTRGANFAFGKELTVLLGDNKFLIKKSKFTPSSVEATLELGELAMGDLNKDNKINADDTNLLLKAVNRSNVGDINNDGVTNSFDWSVLIRYLGRSGD